jgi:hypothetical protein
LHGITSVTSVPDTTLNISCVVIVRKTGKIPAGISGAAMAAADRCPATVHAGLLVHCVGPLIQLLRGFFIFQCYFVRIIRLLGGHSPEAG